MKLNLNLNLKLNLKRNERIVAVVPELAQPGLYDLLHVHIVDHAAVTHRVEYLQRDELPLEVRVLYQAGAVIHAQMLRFIERDCK